MTRAAHRSTTRSTAPLAARATVIGALGELLLTLGVLLGLFLVWQLWWTDVEGQRVQAQVVEDLGWAGPPPTEDAGPVERTDPAPVMDVPAHGVTFATLQVPRWGGEPSPISQGTTKRDILDRLGIGHYDGTAMPGGIGNFAVAGHRTTYGKPFNRVEELQIGDALVVRTESTWYVYRVTSTEVVPPSAVEVIDPVPEAPGAVPTVAQMTMTTCHPLFSARERFIVHSQLESWLPVSEGTPTALDAVDPSEDGA
ncbi:class E sortase [Actinotalea sp.]|uniref:class E sortase n=1 Tax=Actinotalea sp. TaxID=1872145 RepID=UPI003563F47D